jgi:GLPGLI family protein
MNRIVWMVLLLSLSFSTAYSQVLAGRIEYKRTSYWTRILDYLPYLSQAERERTQRNWSRSDGYTTTTELLFDGQLSLYQEVEEEREWYWRKETFHLLRDHAADKRSDIVEMPDRIYLIEDAIPRTRWKILSEIRDIKGYICMSAETRDTIKNQRIVAWFATDLPLPHGPEGFGGLPGMILELDINDGAVVITASEVRLEQPAAPIALPKMKRLRTITAVKYEEQLQQFIQQSMAAERNPYWSIRY